MMTGHETLMRVAVKEGWLERAQKLVEMRPELIRYCDNEGHTWIHIAVNYMEPEMVRWLAGQGVNVNQSDHEGCVPLWRCGYKTAWLDTFQALLEVGANPNAAYAGMPILSSLARADASPAQLTAARLLLAHGALPNERDALGETPLQSAAIRGDRDLVMLLLNAGARIDGGNDDVIAMAEGWGRRELADEMRAWVHAQKARNAIETSSHQLPDGLAPLAWSSRV